MALFSCSNASGGYDSSSSNRKSYPVVRFVANMQSDFAAAPQEISSLVSRSAGTTSFLNDGASRSAMPSVEISDAESGAKYYIEAVCGTERKFNYGTTSTLELGLESGKTWSVTCGIGEIEPDSETPDDHTKGTVLTVYMSDNDPSVTITPDNPVYVKTFGLKPSITTDGTGTINLKLKIMYDTWFVKVSCSAQGWIDAVGSETLVLNEHKDNVSPILQIPSIKSGIYDVVFKFYDDKDALNYCTVQTINVFDDMTTSVWRDDGSGAVQTESGQTVFNVTDAVINLFTQNTMYVGATGLGLAPDNQNSGTAFEPLATLQEAAYRIKKYGQGADYTIFVSGTVQGCTTFDDDITSGNAKTITIMGYNDSGDKLKGYASKLGDIVDFNGVPLDTYFPESKEFNPVITVKTAVPITIQNVDICEGASNGGSGLCIDGAGCSVTIKDGVTISGNKTGKNGGGVSVRAGKFYMKGGKITGNSAFSSSTGTSYGGGVCLRSGAYFEMTGGEISSNRACFGGGVAMLNLGSGVNADSGSNKFFLKRGKISQNTADGFYMSDGAVRKCGYGGGIMIMSGDETVHHQVTMTGGEISGNKVNVDSSAVEVSASAAFTMTGGVIKDNSLIEGESDANYHDISVSYSANYFCIGGSAYIPAGTDKKHRVHLNSVKQADASLKMAKINLDSNLSRHSQSDPLVIQFNTSGEHAAKRGATVASASFDLTNAQQYILPVSSDWNLKLSSDKKSLVLDAPIWVAGEDAQQCTGTPSEDGPGTKSHPYDSIRNACAAMTDPSVDYTIYIDGKLTGPQETRYMSTPLAASITIQGANGDNSVDVLDGNSYNEHVLSLYAQADTTIKYLKITGANITTEDTGTYRTHYGGGVFSATEKSVTLSSGTLIAGNRTVNGGGGVYKENGKLIIEDGAEISGSNMAANGGGVYIDTSVYNNNLCMASGQIACNGTQTQVAYNGNGGGIYILNDGRPIVDISGGSIKNNRSYKGGAIYNDGSSIAQLKIGGAADIPYGTDKKNDVYLNNNYSLITLASSLSPREAKNAIAITLNTSGANPFTHGSTVFKTDPERAVSSDELNCVKLSAEHEAAGLALTLSSDNKSLRLDKPIYVKQGGTPSGSGTADGTKTKPYASVQAATAGMNNESLDYTIKIDACEEPLTGNQNVDNNAKANSILIIGANGLYPADHEKAGQPKDCIQGGSIYSSAADVKNLKIQNLKITGNNKISTSGGSGGGVCSSVNTTLTLCSGTLITENTANRGGGVYKKGGTLVIESGVVIKGNTVVTDSYVTGYGSIEDRGIGCGGGIFLDEGTSLVMSGGTISSNSAENKGGGIYVQNASNANPKVSLFIYGDAVIGGVPSPAAYPTNKAKALAAGGNSAPYGGGIYIKDAILSKDTLYLGYSAAESDGTPKTPTGSDAFTGCISGNYASSEGGGIHLYYATLYYNSGEISFNNSSYGGGIRPYCGHVKMSGGTIANNYASGWGGAVYNYGDFTLTSNPCTAYIPYGINGSEGAGKNDVYHQYSSTIKIDDGAVLTMASPIATVHFGTYSRGKPVLSGSDLDWWCEHFALTSSDWAIGGEGMIVSALPLTVTYDLNITDTKAAPAASAFSLVDALYENTADNPAIIDEDNLFITNILKPSYDGFVGTGDKIFKFAGWDANNNGTADITIAPDATSFYYPENFLDYVAATAHAITLKAVWTEDTSPSDDTLEAVYSNITYDTSYYNDHDEFRIYTAEQAKQVFNNLSGEYFAERNISTGIVTAGTEKTITLMSDIDLGSMAPSCEIFCGILDGNDHTLTASISKNNSGNGCGLFQANHGTVKNLTLAGTITASGSVHYVGGICGSNSGTVDNCTVTATVKATSYSKTDSSASVGGIAGKSFGSVTNCTFSGTVEGGGKRAVGGVVGYAISGSVTGNTIASSATIKYTGTDTTGASIGPIIGKGDASGNSVELGVTVDGGVLTANAIGYEP